MKATVVEYHEVQDHEGDCRRISWSNL